MIQFRRIVAKLLNLPPLKVSRFNRGVTDCYLSTGHPLLSSRPRFLGCDSTLDFASSMGGHAFGTTLGPLARFPRMNPATYERLREYVISLLTTRFSNVVIAREDPAKSDFGDLDVVIATGSYTRGKEATHMDIREDLLALLRAERAVSNGSQFISFAIAASTLDTHVPKKGTDSELEDAPLNQVIALDVSAVDSDVDADVVIYHQVDLNLAKDDDEMEAMPFCSSYGDLGMIISLIFKTVGMSYSIRGLKIVFPPYTQRIDRPFHLTTATASILSFLQLDYAVWKAGFSTRTDIYNWILSSRLANPTAILAVSPKHLERPMYQQFLQHARQQIPLSQDGDGEADPPLAPFPDPDTVIKEALEFFGKAEEYYPLARSVEVRKGLKKALNSKLVQEVTGLQGSVVGKIIARVKEMATAEDLVTRSEDEIRVMIGEARVVVTSANTIPP